MAVPNIDTFGCTDETYGYFRNLQISNVCQRRLVHSGAGVVKYRNSYSTVNTVTGEYVYIATDTAVSGKLGTDVALTISDGDSPGNIYLNEYTITKTGGENPQEKVCRFVGEYYPSLAS